MAAPISTGDPTHHLVKSDIILSLQDPEKTIVLKSMSTSGSKRYLNSSGGADKSESVYLSDSIDYTHNPGCHWKRTQLDDGSFHFESQTPSGNKRLLDSSAAARRNESVYLEDNSAGMGSHWTYTQLPDGSYSLESQTPSGPKRFMDSGPTGSKENSVYLAENTNPIGTHWMIGVDYFTSTEVKSIIRDIYPTETIYFYMPDPNYGSLDYDLLHRIWRNSNLGRLQPIEQKFDSYDFAVCMKGEISKYSYNQTRPTDMGSLCGIIWGRKGIENHAFNFTVDPFSNLILFEPETGQQIDHDEYVPFLCLV